MTDRRLMTADDVHGIIAEMAKAKTSKLARIALAKAAIKHGRVDESGLRAWRDYLASLEA